jgi:quercetin dioxygenase-like cupin family protein
MMKPTHTQYGSVESRNLPGGMTFKVLLTGADTNGLQAVFEDIVDPGVGPGRHIHHKQDETFFFLEGTFDVEIDGEVHRMHAGDVAFIPKGAVHAWKNVGEDVGRLRYVFSPALDIEEMFKEMHESVLRGDPIEEVMERVAKNYPDQEMAGPPM